MRSRRWVALAGVLATLTACTTSTQGSGHGGIVAGGMAGSSGRSADFPAPTALATAPVGTASVAPTTPLPNDTAPATASTSAPASPSTHPVPSTPLRSATVTAPDGSSYLVQVWASVQTPTCADHAYGQPMIDFLRAHKCFGLTRRLATTTVHGHAVGLAISDLGFTGRDPGVYKTAGDFVKLVTRNGTGNLVDLLRDGYRLPAGPTSVPSPDAFSAQGQDAGVEVVDAWYLDGPTRENDPDLVTLEQSIFLQVP
jgi:hypothetical protein